MGTRTAEPSISESEYQRKLEEFQALAKEGFDDIAAGNYISLRSREEIHDFVNELLAETEAEFAAERKSA